MLRKWCWLKPAFNKNNPTDGHVWIVAHRMSGYCEQKNWADESGLTHTHTQLPRERTPNGAPMKWSIMHQFWIHAQTIWSENRVPHSIQSWIVITQLLQYHRYPIFRHTPLQLILATHMAIFTANSIIEGISKFWDEHGWTISTIYQKHMGEKHWKTMSRRTIWWLSPQDLWVWKTSWDKPQTTDLCTPLLMNFLHRGRYFRAHRQLPGPSTGFRESKGRWEQRASFSPTLWIALNRAR